MNHFENNGSYTGSDQQALQVIECVRISRSKAFIVLKTGLGDSDSFISDYLDAATTTDSFLRVRIITAGK